MDPKTIAKQLHPLERKVVPHLKDKINFEELVSAANISEIEVMRALQWLSNKKAITLNEKEEELIILGKNGLHYKTAGLPEKRLLNALQKKSLALSELTSKAKLDKSEINICIGTLKKKAAIDVKKDKELIFTLTEQGKKLLQKESLEEQFLKNSFPRPLSSLKAEEKFAYDELKKRKEMIHLETKKHRSITLTDLGKKLQGIKLDNNAIDKLTVSIIKSESWKGKEFRAYDVSINVPQVHGGKKHFVSQAIEYIRKIWIELGFSEMQGSMVQTGFWDLDSLFVPQDHPARQMQDTFYVKNPAKGELPPLAKKIQAVHENGADTGSSGWGGKWSSELASENLLRTHTTVLSAQTIAKLKKTQLPAKFFSVGRVFRNEAVDWKHLFELTQVEGIVVDPNANFRNLKGYLREFFAKMGYPDVRIRPGHFPYTEPSAEVDVYDPKKKKWIELGGSGIFRPEVTKPLLGFECPVLAWGLGMERTIAEYWNISDIRELYKNDLAQLKEMKQWLK